MSDKKYRVLVVDDNRDSAESMAEFLTPLSGFEVQTCFDGPSALTVCETFRPDACLLDINMPGMDGYEPNGQRHAARTVRQAPAGVRHDDRLRRLRAPRTRGRCRVRSPVHQASRFARGGREQLDSSVRKGESVEDDRSVLRRLLERVFGQWSQRNEK